MRIQFNPFDLAPRDAIEYMKKKGYKPTWDWYEMMHDQHVRTFTAAKTFSVDVLRTLKEAVVEAQEQGIPFREFARRLEPKLRELGWWDEVINPETGEVARVGPWRLRTIYNVNIRTAYSVGRYRAITQPEILAVRPFWEYVAVMDGRTRPEHAALNGTVLRADDPFWERFYPPNGWNCRCAVRTLSADEVEREGRTVQDGSLINTRGLADEGWDYNPGRYAWKPDPAKYPPEFRHMFQEGPLMKINNLDDLNEAFSRFYSDLFYHKISDRVFEVDDTLTGLEAKYIIDERKVRISKDMKDAILSSLSKLKGNIPLTIEEERAIKNLWHEIIHGQTPVYGVLPGLEHTVMETFVETLARTTYNRFVEYLGYPAERLSHRSILLFDSYGRLESGELIRILKSNYEGNFDLIIRALGETIRGYPEYKWFDVFKKKLEVIIGEDNAREVLNEVFRV